MTTRNQMEKAIAVIHRTNDGEDLDPVDLKLVEMAVNELLNEAGIAKFNGLYETVAAGKYRKPWLNGIEHLTRNHEGYVLWKGYQVEHFNAGYASTEAGKAECVELARRCRYLEKMDIEPGVGKCVWRWEEDYEADSRKQPCPICGERIALTGTVTTNDRLVGSCGDAFTKEQWDAE